VYDYTLFGLRIRATRVLPGLVPLTSGGAADVLIDLETVPAWLRHDTAGAGDQLYESPDRDEAGRPLVTVARSPSGELFSVRYADGIEFVLDHAGTRIWARWPEPWTLDDVATYLLGPVLAFLLRGRGVTCLHASAIVVDGQAVALVGPPGAGKSTLAAAFARRGHSVLSDDVVALADRAGRFFIEPGTLRIRLWPESVITLYGDAEALPRLTPTWDKRYLELTVHDRRFESRSLPVASIYCLAGRTCESTAPRIEPLPPMAGLVTLVANTHANHFLDGAMRAQEFECLSLVVGSVPIRCVVPHEDPARLSRLCDVIVHDARALRLDSDRAAEVAGHV
jgi:hypothetical protein